MQLTDFFSPLNLQNTSLFVLFILVMDALGVNIARFLPLPSFLRLVFWIIGLGLFVFLWFILHFFIPFAPEIIWVSLAVIAIFCLPFYIKHKGPFPLLIEFIKFPFPIIFLFFIFKPLFFLASLPPYIWDEMAYHYWPPARVFLEQSWNFYIANGEGGFSFYDMLPRFLETAFTLLFSITKTYSTARLLHFLIFFSIIYAVALFLKKNISFLSALIYSYLALFLTINVTIGGTSGYIDAGAAAFSMMFFILSLGFLIHKTRDYLYAGSIFFALAVATKYTVLSFIVSILASMLIFLLIFSIKMPNISYTKLKKDPFYKKLKSLFQILRSFKRITFNSNLLKEVLNLRILSLILLLLFLFGGYWYSKNFALTGNPTYPFIFPCKNDIPCGSQNSSVRSFKDWVVPFSEVKFEDIKDVVFQENDDLYNSAIIALLISVVFFFITNRKLFIIIPTFLLLILSIELKLAALTPGFSPRFNLHWTMLVPFVLALPFTIAWKQQQYYFAATLITINIFGHFVYQSAGLLAQSNIDKVNDIKYVTPIQRNFVRERMSLAQWLVEYFPNMNNAIQFCGQKRELTNLLVSDPSLIWDSTEGLMRVFLVNCNQILIPPPKDNKIDEYIKLIKEKYPNSYVVSKYKCNPNKKSPYEDLSVTRFYNFNQELVCKGKQVAQNIYTLP